MDTIGKRIRALRKEHHLTMKELHELTGLSTGNISDMEHDRYMPSVASLIPLSKALNCSVDWILTGNDNVQKSESLLSESNIRLSESERDMLQMFRALDEGQKEELFELIHFKYKRYVEEKRGSIYSTYAEGKKMNGGTEAGERHDGGSSIA